MKKNKFTLTVGIPIFNEEANIENLINNLLNQKNVNYKLENIIIVNDASSDNSINIVNKIRNKKIILVNNRKRLGQQLCLNIIVGKATSDLLLCVEGDVLLSDNSTIDKLVCPFIKHKNITMTIGMPKSVKSKGFYESVLNRGLKFRTDLFSKWKHGVNVYTCGGHSMKVIKRNFYSILVWPKNVPEDAYTYFTALENKFKIFRVTGAFAFMKNPTNFADRLKQVSKFQNGKTALRNYFSVQTVKSEYNIPIKYIFLQLAESIKKKPILLIMYFFDAAFSRIVNFKKNKFNALYNPYMSTKNLNQYEK